MNPWLTLLILGLALLGAVLGVGGRWRRWGRRQCLFGLISTIFPAPGRISLELLPDSAGKNSRVARRAAAFREMGFEPVATFGLHEMPGARVHVLSHAAMGLVGLVHEHSCAGTWSDVMRFSGNGEPPILASNLLKRAHFLCLPGEPRFHHPDAPESELVRIVQESRAHTGAAQLIDAPLFQKLCEQAYADAADERWRHPPDENEVRRLLKELGTEGEPKDEDVAGVHASLPEWIAEEWRKAALHELLKNPEFSAREWQQSRVRVLVIHDHTPLRNLKRSSFHVFLTPDLKKRLQRSRGGVPPRAEFAAINSALPASQRYAKLGSVARPVPADVFRAPLQGGV